MGKEMKVHAPPLPPPPPSSSPLQVHLPVKKKDTSDYRTPKLMTFLTLIANSRNTIA